jgi:methionyl-tRNA formyltransferase
LRIAILSNTLPAALPIYEAICGQRDADVFVVLCPAAEQSRWSDLLKHIARWAIKAGRMTSMRLLLRRRVVLLWRSLDHPASLAELAKKSFDLGLHKTGNIYRQATLNCFRLGILNAHIGLLPKYRGRSVVEWSILQGDPPGVSVFFIDPGIDTGPRIVLSEKVDISKCRSLAAAKSYLFNLDASFYKRAIDLLKSDALTYKDNDGSGRRYYVMSKLFQDVAKECFQLSN